ncbi:MAG: glycosyltransferase family 2 protein [Verrucomicrobiota bacterium]
MISVILPFFNRLEAVRRAIRSLQAQTFSGEWEVILVDDGSTSPRAELKALSEQAKNAGMRFIKLPQNCGVAAARCAGVEEARGDWFAFLDSDDEWLPPKLQTQLAWHDEHPDIRVSQVSEMWLRDGRTIKKPRHLEQRAGNLFAEAVERCVISPSCVMLSRDLWIETGGFDARFRVCEDYAWWLQVTAKEEIGLIPGAPLVRKHDGAAPQLSRAIPVLDRWRVVALLERIIEPTFSAHQRATMKGAAIEKARRIHTGAEKRGHRELAQLFANVAQVLDSDASINRSLLAAVWASCDLSSDSELTA